MKFVSKNILSLECTKKLSKYLRIWCSLPSLSILKKIPKHVNNCIEDNNETSTSSEPSDINRGTDEALHKHPGFNSCLATINIYTFNLS